MKSAAQEIANDDGGQSESAIIKRHERLIRFVALPFARHGVALDDLVQEGRIAVLTASRTWRASEGVKLWTYARRAVVWAMLRFVAQEINEPGRDTLLPSDVDSDGDGLDGIAAESKTPEESTELAECMDIVKDEVSALTETERQVLWAHFGEGRSLRDIAQDMTPGAHHSTVQRIYNGALGKLRNGFEARV